MNLAILVTVFLLSEHLKEADTQKKGELSSEEDDSSIVTELKSILSTNQAEKSGSASDVGKAGSGRCNSFLQCLLRLYGFSLFLIPVFQVFQIVGFVFVYARPQFDLRPNEPRALEVASGTVWEVRDLETSYYMLTNDRKRFRVVGGSGNGFIDLRIKRPSFLERKLKDFIPVSEKFLRFLVVADASVTNYYGKRLGKKLLMTIMSAVSKIFRDKSLGIKVNIVVTKIIMAESDPRSYKVVENDPDTSITNACSFASSLARANGISHHDFATVITRKSIGPSGYAAMYTMCTSRSCTLVKENGFNTAYVIAHEAGHALGIDHDGEDGECEDDKLQGSIMSPKVYSKHEKYHWSFCSKRSLYENIRYFSCLNYKPTESENNIVDKFYDLPGEVFPKDSQCKAKLGSRAKSCQVSYGACEFLWCQRTSWAGCIAMALTSPLEGTSCAPRKWCIKGKCVDKKKPKAPKDGSWGPWSIFGPCKGVCGAGVRTRVRECDSPAPMYGGKYCRGVSKDVDSCKLQDCWLGFSKPLLRAEKCKKYGADWVELTDEMEGENLKKAGITCDFQTGACGWSNDAANGQQWLRTNAPTKSSLTGPSADHTFGTRGGYYAYFEASWIVASFEPVKGTSSKLLSKTILVSTVCLSFFYHMYGEQMGSLKLLKKMKGKELDTLWLKEGQQGNEWFGEEITVQSEEEYQLVFEAIRGDGYRSDIGLDDINIRTGACKSKDSAPGHPECEIMCHSPLKRKLKALVPEDGFPCQANSSLHVCYDGQCLIVGCDYKVKSRKTFDQCGICGGDGKSCKLVNGKKAVKALSKFTEVYVIPEGSEHVEIKMERNSRLFPGVYIDNQNATNVFNADGYNWPTGNYTVYNPFANNSFLAAFKTEVSIAARLPLTVGYDQFEYRVRSWTKCSQSCGGGVQQSIPTCYEKRSERIITDLYCNDIIGGELARVCNTQQCTERYSWRLGSWSACTATCGIGIKARRVRCLDNNANRIVQDGLCKDRKPSEIEPCLASSCTEHSFFTEPWSRCSKTCDQGIQVRRAGCSLTNQPANNKPLITCAGEFPVTAKPCNNGPCNIYKWVPRFLSYCSASCGGGLRIRTHSCRHMKSGVVVISKLCSSPKPSSITSCNKFDCK
eukprot:gene5025-133_t